MASNTETKRRNIVAKLKEKANNANRQYETGLINTETKSSVMLEETGDIVVASSKTSQYRARRSNGANTEIGFTSNTITNRKNLETNDFVYNKHKLNPSIYEFTDFKTLYNDETLSIGNLTMNATVLIKAWEPNLKQWVLIRRPMRTPVFSNALNIAGAIESTGIDDNIKGEIEQMTKLDKKRSEGNCLNSQT